MSKIRQSDLDNIADVIWWIKGYIAGARDNYEECPFNESHIDSLRDVRIKLLKELKNEQN